MEFRRLIQAQTDAEHRILELEQLKPKIIANTMSSPFDGKRLARINAEISMLNFYRGDMGRKMEYLRGLSTLKNGDTLL